MIKAHDVFYYDIKSQLETYYQCKVEKPKCFNEFGNLVSEQEQMKKTLLLSDLSRVNDYESGLNEEEKPFFFTSKCQSHQPTLYVWSMNLAV